MAHMTLAAPTMQEENTHRRELLHSILKFIDIAVGITAIVGGVFAIAATPPTVMREVSVPLLVWIWGGLLIIGGFGGALGRITGIWLLETTGIVAMGAGTLIYIAVVGSLVPDQMGLVVAITLFVVALLSMVRRYVELQIFLSEPDEPGFVSRLHAAFRLRVPNTSLRR